MPRFIRYFLVAQNHSDYNFEIVKLCPQDYSDSLDDTFFSGHKLEEIDLFTMCFSNKEELSNYLYEMNRINSLDVDLSIAFQKGGKLNFYDVLYYRKDNNILSLKKIAKDIEQQDNSTYKYSEYIIDSFIKKVQYDDNLYNMLVCGMSNIYGKFLNYFKTKSHYDGIEKLKKLDGAWMFRSYSLLRNIVDIQQKYHQLLAVEGDFSRNIMQIYKGIERKRLKGIENLSIKLDPDYIPDQLTLFDWSPECFTSDMSRCFTPSSSNDKLIPIAPNDYPTKFKLHSKDEDVKLSECNLKKKSKSKKLEIPNYDDVSQETKISEVLMTIKNLSIDSFSLVDKSKAIFNCNSLHCLVSDDDQEKLARYLDSTTRLHFYLYALFSYRVKESLAISGYVNSQLYEDINHEYAIIKKRLMKKQDKSNCLNRAYAWSRLYNQYLEKQEQSCENMSGEVCGKRYRKS